MAKFCPNCGKEAASNESFCSGCGTDLNNVTNEKNLSNVVSNSNVNTTTDQKDYTVAGFVCSLVGFLCCTYVAIPGLIFSIMSYNDMKNGKISSDKKWMAITGIVLSVLGLLFMVYNFINPNTTITNMVNEWLS